VLVSVPSFACAAVVATAFSDEHANLPTCFDPNFDVFANDSIDFKKNSSTSSSLHTHQIVQAKGVSLHTHQIVQAKGVSLHTHQILIWVLCDLAGFKWDLIWVLCDDGWLGSNGF
jgi:hypothetical protein